MFPIRFGTLAGAALFSVWCAPAGFAADACAMHQIASIPATVSPQNELLLDATINDVPVKIQVDTGATVSTLSKSFAARIGLPIENMAGYVYGLSGVPLDQKTHVRSMHLGTMTSASETFVLMPTGSDGADGQPVGLFGGDYLQNYDVEIDAAGGKVVLFAQDHCPGQVVYWAPEFFKIPIHYAGNGPLHQPVLEVLIDGKPMRAVVDTGAYANIMRLAAARDRFGLSPDSPDMRKLGVTHGVDGKQIETYEHVFQSLTFGGITLHNTKLVIAPIDTSAHVNSIGSHIKLGAVDDPDLYVGMSLLKQLHIFVAYRENALYFTVASAGRTAKMPG
jgi:predicted aspartyl protease